MKHRMILDCDPGHDDAIAILLAGHHPEIDLLAVTTVAGNQDVEKTTRNALKVCSFAQLTSIPIARGMERPLVRESQHATNIHGQSGLDGPHIPEPVIEPVAMHAVDLIIDTLMKSDGDITLVATGPLTNIATAMRQEPTIIPKIKAISLMGGAIGLGNVTPAAEFNIHFDAEAAAVVFNCGRPITMAPLEVTHMALATDSVIDRLRTSQKSVAMLAADLLVYFAETYRKVFGFPSPPLHDPCAVAVVIDPSIMRTKIAHVAIETTGDWTYGRTVCDIYGSMKRVANAHVGYTLDVTRFWAMVIDTLLTYD
jgi:inosine-uridine nucleoside N-ribohydrolase